MIGYGRLISQSLASVTMPLIRPQTSKWSLVGRLDRLCRHKNDRWQHIFPCKQGRRCRNNAKGGQTITGTIIPSSCVMHWAFKQAPNKLLYHCSMLIYRTQYSACVKGPLEFTLAGRPAPSFLPLRVRSHVKSAQLCTYP